MIKYPKIVRKPRNIFINILYIFGEITQARQIHFVVVRILRLVQFSSAAYDKSARKSSR